MSGSPAGELAALGAQRRTVSGSARGARGKKVYGITEAGRRRLVELRSDPDVPDDRPPTQVHDDVARDSLDAFISGR